MSHIYHWWAALKRIPKYREDVERALQVRDYFQLRLRWGIHPDAEDIGPLPHPDSPVDPEGFLYPITLEKIDPESCSLTIFVNPYWPKSDIKKAVHEWPFKCFEPSCICSVQHTARAPIKALGNNRFELRLEHQSHLIKQMLLKQVKTEPCPRSCNLTIWKYFDLKNQGLSIYEITRKIMEESDPNFDRALIADSAEKKKVERGIKYASKWIALVLHHRIQFELTD